jgi:mannose-1-phosphate guanylyltransferase
MFLLPARGYLDELRRLDGAMHEASRRAFTAAVRDLDFVRLDRAAFESCRPDSIDYAVMEKTDRAAVVPLDAGWNDVGSFASLQDALPGDSAGNVMHGDVIAEDTKDSLLYSTRAPDRRGRPRGSRRDRDQGRSPGCAEGACAGSQAPGRADEAGGSQ